MRSSILYTVPFVAAAFAQDSSSATVVSISSGDTTLETTYSNPNTQFLTQTDSNGVITGQPTAVTEQPAAETSIADLPEGVFTQPSVATIPAGLPTGLTYIAINISATLTSFQVSVGSSTTVVVDAPAGATVVTDAEATDSASATVISESDASSESGASATSSGDAEETSSASESASGTDAADESSATQSGDAAEQTDDSAAGHLKVASAGVVGFGALVAALL